MRQDPSRKGRVSAPDAPPDGPVPRPRLRSTFEGTVFSAFALLFALSALALGENLVFFMGCLGLGFVLATRILCRRNVRGLRLACEAPRRARVGVPLPVTYALHNPRRRRAVAVDVDEAAPTRGRAARRVAHVRSVAARETVRVTTHRVFGRRGWHVLGPLRLRSAYPLGLGEARVEAPATARVLARPREGRPRRALRRLATADARGGPRPDRHTRGPDVFHGIREYREGDDPRRIHWRTTARRGALTIAEWHREEARDLVVILGRCPSAGPSSRRAFERAVSAAATLVRLGTRSGARTRLLLGHPGRDGARPGGRDLPGLLDRLALVKPQGGRRPRAALRRLARGSDARRVIYVAAGPEPGIRARLRAAAGRRGESLLLRADGPRLARWIEGLDR